MHDFSQLFFSNWHRLLSRDLLKLHHTPLISFSLSFFSHWRKTAAADFAREILIDVTKKNFWIFFYRLFSLFFVVLAVVVAAMVSPVFPPT